MGDIWLQKQAAACVSEVEILSDKGIQVIAYNDLMLYTNKYILCTIEVVVWLI